jgi:phenylalanyl-tRNA synthetase alpha chain
MDELHKIAEMLHPLERKIFPLLKKHKLLSELIDASGLPEAAVMRAVQWLQNKQLIVATDDSKKRIELDRNGKEYVDKGLPEFQLLRLLQKSHTELLLSDAQEKLEMQLPELQVAIGMLKRRNLIALNKIGPDKTIIQLTEDGRNLKESHEEQFLKWIGAGRFNNEIIKHDDRTLMHELLGRKEIIKENIIKDKVIELTHLGKEMLEVKLAEDIIDSLTPEMLQTGSWKNKRFRRYDIHSEAPKLYGGKKQHYRLFHDMVRRKFLAMGFSEMFGPIVESDFWDMDALYMPQFHSARDIHQAYYLKEPKAMEIDQKLLKNVKDAHESGFDTGSKGWRYKFDMDRTKRTLLRTQGTACSVRMLASKNLKIPGKYFAIAKCFRYDVVDATHLPDFFQTEGIVVDQGLNFQSLKGLLKMFAEEFTENDQIKIKPAYFPFTEPSAELFAKHPELGWIELGGSGIFRPEVTKPLGIDVPVIAWGLGIDRIGMFNMKINDIRNLYSQDLNFLRNQRI